MKQNKAKFIFDLYIVAKDMPTLNNVTSYLNSARVAYCVEPWPEYHYRIYVRKDSKRALGVIDKAFDRGGTG